MSDAYQPYSQSEEQGEKRAHFVGAMIASAQLIVGSIWKIIRETVYEVFKIRLP